MERYIGGTEMQMGLFPLKQSDEGEFDILDPLRDVDDLANELIDTNNTTKLYGIFANTNNECDGVCSWLFNGGFLCTDLCHPEYATPEIKNLRDIPVYEMAGKLMVDRLLKLTTLSNPTHIAIANNTDHHGQTYAYHENYLLGKEGLEKFNVRELLPFLATRQIMTGAGHVFLQPVNRQWFSISQRSLFVKYNQYSQYNFEWYKIGDIFVGDYSAFTGPNRHNQNLLHVTGGDTNVTYDTTMLKIGSTALVQQLIEDGFKAPNEFHLNIIDTIDNINKIALDSSFRWPYAKTTAIEVQRKYINEARKRFYGRDEDTNWTINTWQLTLDSLETDPLKANWIDWVRKFNLISKLQARGWNRSDLVKVDLSFHSPDPQRSVLKLLGGTGVPEKDINKALYHPPQNTRALGRSLAIRVLEQVEDPQLAPYIDWDRVEFSDIRPLNMPNSKLTYLAEAARFQSDILMLK